MRRLARKPLSLMILFFGLTLATGLPVNAVGQTDDPASGTEPRAVVAELHSGLITASNTFADAPIEERYAALEPLIRETHDLPFIARFAMRRHWGDLTDEQQAEYMDTFTRLSIATYASRFQGLTDETFGITGQTDQPRGHIEINGTLMQNEGEKLTINYVLHRSDEDWLIINIVVDGVSDLALKRAEYQRVFSDTGFSGLVDYLSGQISELMPDSMAKAE